MRLKIRIDDINPQHVHCTIFSDPSPENNGTFANLGKLTMLHEEYRAFVSALVLGHDQMKGQFLVMEDPKFEEYEALRRKTYKVMLYDEVEIHAERSDLAEEYAIARLNRRMSGPGVVYPTDTLRRKVTEIKPEEKNK